MGVKLKKYKGKWYLFIDYDGKRKAKCLGTDRKLAESIKRQVEAKLVLGGLGVFGTEEEKLPTFGVYADSWMKDYARVECKTSTADGYEGVLRQYLLPRFANNRLDEITRDQIKSMINELVAKNLSRNTIRNALCVIRGMINQAIEGGLLGFNPASRLGRFTRTAKSAEKNGVSLRTEEVQTFLDAASEICPEYYPLFLTAFRAGLRRGELVALQMGDLNFGKDENDLNRYIFVQHNYVHREHTSTKSKKARRVDMSKDLRKTLVELRDKRLLEAFMRGMNDISDELVFPSPDGCILDPDNLYHRYFLPVLAKAGIRKIRLHDLRHTFGSLLIQAGASYETKGRRVQPSIPLHVINHLPASVFSFANISEQNSLYCHPCQSEILVQHLRYPPNVIGEQVSVLHSGSGVHMAQGLHATLQRHAQGILRSSVAVTESVQATLETQSFQHWGDHPMGKVVRVQPLTFLRQKQRLVRPSPSGQFAQARCQPRRDGKRPRSFALGVGDVLSEPAAADFDKAAVETHVADIEGT